MTDKPKDGGAERWWGLKVNGELEWVSYGTFKEVWKNSDVRELVDTNFDPPIIVELVPLTVTEDADAAQRNAKP